MPRLSGIVPFDASQIHSEEYDWLIMQHLNILISIVIPLYNKGAYIGKTLDSVLNQSFDKWEALVVDDGSTDFGPEIVQKYVDADPRIRLISKKNGGVSSARNVGIAHSQGVAICFLDADDEWLPGHLSEIWRLRQSYPKAELFFDQAIVKKNGKYRKHKWYSECKSEGYLFSYADELAKCPNLINSSNVAISKSLLNRTKTWFMEEDSIGEDLELWLRLSLDCYVAFSSSEGAIYNRDVEVNARNSNSVHYPRGYLMLINQLLTSGELDDSTCKSLQSVRDRKTVAYIFSLISSGNRNEARLQLSKWSPASSYSRCKPLLRIACCFPSSLIRAVVATRMRLL